ncbi:SAD1 protein [Plenodomus tracheiphilus IPT5]|uniref:SAD1 protein n=1 Tax=Plenodomus tracheiphilus IPT5 TaxID=1408161 RepID=A0A6A7BML0_9PLEO|nr:SAD1 protein [Plenodomus tracheiphilus IPT5]
MSQLGNTGAPTPRRSGRISNKASSIAETAVTTVTTGGTRLRRTGPLTKVKARKSNAYGASGRVGAAEELSVTATGFAQAFQNQRGDAFARDDEDNDDDDEDDDSVDELAAPTPRMSGARNGRVPASSPPRSPSLAPQVPSMSAPGLSFLQSEDTPASEDDLATSVGNTSKSFGPLHEAGMLGQSDPSIRPHLRFSSPQGSLEPTPVVQKSTARRNIHLQARSLGASQIKVPLQGQSPPPVRPSYLQTPAPGRTNGADIARRRAIDESVDALFAEEQARLLRDGPPQPRPQQQPRERRRHVNSPRAVDDWLGNVELPQKDEVEWPWRKYLTWAFWAIAATILIGWLMHSMTSPTPSGSGANTNTPGLFSAVNARVSYTMGRIAKLVQPPPTIEEEIAAFRAGDDNIMWRRMYTMNEQFESRINGVHSTIDELRNELPDLLIVRRHEDGRSEISDDFWQALQSKLRSQGDDTEWLEYLKQTRQKLDDIFDNSVDRDDTKTRPQAVSKQEFLEIIDNRFREISTRVNENIEEAFKSQAEQFKSLISAEAKKAMIDNVRLQSLAQTNLVANYELSLKAPNYFSTGLGAVVEPQLTSATRLDRPRWFTAFAHRLALAPLRNPPSAALTEWKQPGDCWCSAPNIHGGAQSQLTVSLGRPMTPKKVTIEHVPMSMVPARDVSNAPRSMEMWVETDEPIKSYYSQRHQGICGEGLPGWKCLGTFKYNIHASNHLQTFDLSGEPSAPIKRAMLRVTSNWGADHTCLYQVRLHGDDAMEDYEYQVRLND